MAQAGPGPGSPPEARHDWFADFAEEEPDVPARRHAESSAAFDSFTPEAGVPAVHPAGTRRSDAPVSNSAMRIVALAAGLVALAAWWIVPRLGADVSLPHLPPQPGPVVAQALPTPPPVDNTPVAPAEAPPQAAPAGRATAPPDVAPPAAREIATPATPEAQAARAAETPAIDAVIGRYRAAFGALDVDQVAEVWPASDRAALERTFAGLTFQSLEFDGCAIDVRDRDAQASCRGRARVVTKASARTFLEPRRWDFILRKDDRGWVIRSVK